MPWQRLAIGNNNRVLWDCHVILALSPQRRKADTSRFVREELIGVCGQPEEEGRLYT